MENDIFNHCCNATGDIMNATGCILASTPPADLAQLKKEVVRSKTNLAMLETQVLDLEHRASACQKALGFRCKKKYGASKNELYDQRNAKRVERDGAKKAYYLAVSNLKAVEKNDIKAKNEFSACQKTEQEKALADAKIQEQKDILAVEQSKVDVEESKVGAIKMETGKSYVVYGLIGVGAIVAIFLGYKLINK